MARGWESKSVEDQMAAAEHARSDRRPTPLSAEGRERAARRESLRLSRTRALQDLQVACDKRHRALLEQTIEHLDAELARLDGTTRSPSI